MDKNFSILRVQPAVYHPKGMAAVSAVKGGSLPDASFDDMQALYSFEEKYPELREIKTLAEKRAFVRSRHAEVQRELAGLEAELKSDSRTTLLARLKKGCSVLREVEAWAESDLKIERPGSISFRRLRKAVAGGGTVYLAGDATEEAPAHDFEKEIFRFAEVLLIEHDWAGAFENAEMSNAAVKLPYEVCAFEFKISGRAVIALATQFETDIAFSPAIECSEGWLVTGFVTAIRGLTKGSDGWHNLFNILGSQIRAACIALDAEVATSEVVREPYTSAHGKNAHQPLKPYHVVSLANRGPRPLLALGVETGRRVRLHFRRGHWRHLDDHRTWIRWMLCGNPDLGFVDKHYKL